MVILSPRQRLDVELLVDAAIGTPSFLPSVLLVGPMGAGKRTIARASAENLGMEFMEVPLRGPVRYIKETLFGTLEQAQMAESNYTPPGEAGRNPPTLLYLSGLEGLDSSLFQSLHRLITHRRYTDAIGNVWSLSSDLWLVGALTFPCRSQILHPEHWFCTGFQRQVAIDPPNTPEELLEISVSMARQLGREVTVDPSAFQVIRAVKNVEGNMHTLRRWIELAVPRIAPADRLDGPTLSGAMVHDIRGLLSGVSYRGTLLTEDSVDGWLQQFPSELRPLGLQLVRRIANDYYIGQRRFHEALDKLIRVSSIPPGSLVSFCKWQAMGDSADRLANAVKNQARWRTSIEVDLRQPFSRWPSPSQHERTWFVLADDFVGSGRTLASLFAGRAAPVPRLLERYPGSQVRVLIVVGYKEGFQRARAEIAPYRDRVRITASQLLREEDRCFSEQSIIVPDAENRRRFKQFCLDVAGCQMSGLPREFHLGYGETGALVVFYDSVPNNSLPILWCDRGSWRPLFPRSGLPGK